MDIQKEREAFESVFTSENGWDLTWTMGCYQDGRTFNAFAGWKARAQKVAVPEGFVLVEVTDLREIISTASDAMMDEQTSSVYDKTGEPSTWFDHYTVAEKRVLAMIEAQEQN